MRIRPSRGAFARPVLGRLAAVAALGCGLLAIAAPVASAHNVVPVLNDCTSVTFNYTDFPTTGSDSATENVTVNGVTTSKTVNFSNSTTFTDTVPFNGRGANGTTLHVATTLSSTADGFMGTESHDFTLSGCLPAFTYTGRAYDVFAKANLLGITLSPLFINDSGPIATPLASSEMNTVLTESIPLIGLSGGQASQAVNTGVNGNSSQSAAAVNDLAATAILGLKTKEIAATSTTTCTSPGHLTEVGSTTIASLTIAGMNLTIPAVIPPNFVILNIPGVVKVVLNEQLPTADNAGLQVNAIDIHLLGILGTGAQVIVAHAESDLEGC